MTYTPSFHGRPAPRISILAISSLVSSLLGCCTLGIGGLIGVILGVVAMKAIDDPAKARTGRGFAKAGVIVGVVSLLLGVAAAIALPMLGKYRMDQKNNVALSIAGTFAVNADAYAAENGGVIHPADQWMAEVRKNLNAGTPDEFFNYPGDHEGQRVWAMNAKLSGVEKKKVRDPARTVLFFEAAPGTPPGGGSGDFAASPHHSRGYVVSFVDMHAENVPKEKLGDLLWEP
jgi:hypothetical protein